MEFSPPFLKKIPMHHYCNNADKQIQFVMLKAILNRFAIEKTPESKLNN